MKPITEEQALNRLAALCSQAEYCMADMMRRLEQWDIAPEARQRIALYLSKEGYVDDERYARCFVEEKIKYNGWGRRKIEQALYAKHVSPETIRTVLDEVDDALYIEVLQPLLQQKWRTVTGRDDYERCQKLLRFAIGRGFDYDLVKRSIHLITQPEDD